MSPFNCAREKEVNALLDLGQWPQASPAELRAHAGACSRCGDLILVRQAMQSVRAVTAPAHTMPSAGALWWRAQLRKRNQAIETISRPLVSAQIFAFVIVGIVAFAGAFWELRRSGSQFVAWLTQIPHALNFSALLPDTLSTGGTLWFLFPLLGMLALAGGLAVYFTLEKQ